MLFQTFLVVLLDILYGQHGPIVGVVWVVLAEPLIGVDFGQHLYEFLFRVVDGAQQLVVELQNLHPVAVSVPFVVGVDVLIQAGFQPHQLAQDFTVNGLADPSGNG